ncbi:Aste57867_7836 [Aphanomyces stellatus]|uniref:Aste57867_7836 protein n=2 Tax=Aphanomyces stellatus TaxID=120398 RepID=A0A485KIU9_9STRA|nr:hypothetical protein As57867_007806 [Aphanomyces stellatus]VFT84732.1 Aste57867_7836 [Aphanomyces stellatus]
MTHPQESPTRFLLSPLSSTQKTQFRHLATGLLKQALEECDITTHEMDAHWKHTRTHQGLKVYKAKSPQAPSDLMVTGIVNGKLHDVMTCLYADDSYNFRVNSALLMPKDFLDCEVLHAMDTADDDHPFRFHGLKWCATKWPGASALAKNRDLCYFESTGLAQATDNVTGALTTFGYSILESFDLAQCGHLEDLSIVRAKISIRHIFRELPIGCTLVMTHANVDPCGSLKKWGSDFSALPQLLAISRVADVAESIRLTKLLVNSSAATLSHTSNLDWCKPLSFLAQAMCCVCQFESSSKMKKRRVVELASGSGLRTHKRHFCDTCLLASLSTPTFGIARLNLDLQPNCVVEPRPFALSAISSLDLSEYSVDGVREYSQGEFRSLPMLGLDSDDEDDVAILMYTGLDFDMRSTGRSLVDNLDRGSEGVQEAEPALVKMSASAALGSQLAELTARIDDTMSIIRRTKTQIDFCQCHGRIEYH